MEEKPKPQRDATLRVAAEKLDRSLVRVEVPPRALASLTSLQRSVPGLKSVEKAFGPLLEQLKTTRTAGLHARAFLPTHSERNTLHLLRLRRPVSADDIDALRREVVEVHREAAYHRAEAAQQAARADRSARRVVWLSLALVVLAIVTVLLAATPVWGG
jgi:hypothetical protein